MTQLAQRQGPAIGYDAVARIPGWLSRIDFEAFRLVLSTQCATEPAGDLAELGVYQGKSAAVIGAFRRADETFTVVDIFDGRTATDDANTRENEREYDGLSRRDFERWYRTVHPELPVVVEGLSESIVEHASHGTHRFVHVDASHLHEHVVTDIAAARTLLRPGGVVVLDDYRSAHTPGVAAAAWAAVEGGLRPLLLTENKFYGTWDARSPWPERIEGWAARSGAEHEIQRIAGHRVVRLWQHRPGWTRWIPPAAVPFARSMRTRLGALRGIR